MNTKLFCLVVVFMLLLSPDNSEAGGYYRRRSYGRRRGGIGRAIGGAVVTGAAIVGGLVILGALLGRKKRSADGMFDDSEVEELSPYEEALNYFDLAMELDEDMCLEKTLCTIMSTSEKTKDASTLVKILKTIYTGDVALMGVEGHDDATKLLEAGLLGKTAKSAEVCTIAFKTCKKDPKILKKQLEDAYTMEQKYMNL